MDLPTNQTGHLAGMDPASDARPHDEPWELLRRHADHKNRPLQDVWSEHRLTAEELARDPLAP
jgi:hypothetical protein